jgi:hypothetical protein
MVSRLVSKMKHQLGVDKIQRVRIKSASCLHIVVGSSPGILPGNYFVLSQADQKYQPHLWEFIRRILQC